MEDFICKYSADFPVDEYDRPGGLYSLSDLPIRRHKTLTREGVLLAHDASGEMFKIRDTEFGFTRWVSADNITFEDVPIGRIPTDIFSDNFL